MWHKRGSNTQADDAIGKPHKDMPASLGYVAYCTPSQQAAKVSSTTLQTKGSPCNQHKPYAAGQLKADCWGLHPDKAKLTTEAQKLSKTVLSFRCLARDVSIERLHEACGKSGDVLNIRI